MKLTFEFFLETCGTVASTHVEDKTKVIKYKMKGNQSREPVQFRGLRLAV